MRREALLSDESWEEAPFQVGRLPNKKPKQLRGQSACGPSQTRLCECSYANATVGKGAASKDRRPDAYAAGRGIVARTNHGGRGRVLQNSAVVVVAPFEAGAGLRAGTLKPAPLGESSIAVSPVGGRA